MNPLRRRAKTIEGQSRPDGMHLERIPVHEAEAARAEQHPEAGRWTRIGSTQDGGIVYAAPVDKDTAARSLADTGLSSLQDRLTELRTTLVRVNHLLQDVTADRDLIAETSLRRLATIRDLEQKLTDALMLLRAHHADADVLSELTPAAWRDEHPVTERPDRC